MKAVRLQGKSGEGLVGGTKRTNTQTELLHGDVAKRIMARLKQKVSQWRCKRLC